MTKVIKIPICSVCGSSDIHFKSESKFNVITQSFETTDILDEPVCNTCYETTPLKYRKVEWVEMSMNVSQHLPFTI